MTTQKESTMRTSKPISVTLGQQRAAVKRRAKSGRYDNASEVLRAAKRVLDREEPLLDEVLRERVKASMTDKRPAVPAADVFKRLRGRHSRKVKAASGSA